MYFTSTKRHAVRALCVGTGGRGDADAGAWCLSWWGASYLEQQHIQLTEQRGTPSSMSTSESIS